MAMTKKAKAKRPSIHFYAVFDHYNRQLSAGMSYKRALEAKKLIQDMSRTGFLQAIIAVPPFRVKKIQTIRR